MHPVTTTYRMIDKPSEYARCHHLMTRNLMTKEKLGFPTVIAERDEKVIGFLSTHRKDGYVTAGPLVIDKATGPITAMRLLEAYDQVMRALGLQAYLFGVEKKGRWNAVVHRGMDGAAESFKKLAETDTMVWYMRML